MDNLVLTRSTGHQAGTIHLPTGARPSPWSADKTRQLSTWDRTTPICRFKGAAIGQPVTARQVCVFDWLPAHLRGTGVASSHAWATRKPTSVQISRLFYLHRLVIACNEALWHRNPLGDGAIKGHSAWRKGGHEIDMISTNSILSL